MWRDILSGENALNQLMMLIDTCDINGLIRKEGLLIGQDLILDHRDLDSFSWDNQDGLHGSTHGTSNYHSGSTGFFVSFLVSIAMKLEAQLYDKRRVKFLRTFPVTRALLPFMIWTIEDG